MYRVVQGLHENALVGHLIKTYNWDEVEKICDHHPKLLKNCILANSNTPLHEICNIGSAPHDLLEKVLKCRIESTTTRNRFGETPLHTKCRSSQYSLHPVALLVQTNPMALRMLNDSGKSPLAVACVNGASVNVVKELVVAYPEALKIRDVNDHTPIDSLWSSFAKTIPGASAISLYLRKQRGDSEQHHVEMRGVLAKFYQKMSFCLKQVRILSKDDDDDNNEESSELLLSHTIIEENIQHAPHTLLDIFLTYDQDFGCQLDANGNTSFHLQLYKEVNYDFTMSFLRRCPESASIANRQGALPLHLALKKTSTMKMNVKNGWCKRSISEIMRANTEALNVRDPETLLYPFMTAGAIDELDLCYKFLLESPNVVLDLLNVGFNDSE